MINDDITRQIAADYARLLTSTTEGFDLTLAEAIDSDLLPEDVLEQLCEMMLAEGSQEDSDSPTPTKSSSWLPKSISDRLSHWRNARNSTKRNLTGAAFDSSAEKAITRRAHFHAAKAGDVENQKTIRDHLNTKGGLKDKLRAAGIGTKVRVRVDKETGHYHVTDETGKTHVIESHNPWSSKYDAWTRGGDRGLKDWQDRERGDLKRIGARHGGGEIHTDDTGKKTVRYPGQTIDLPVDHMTLPSHSGKTRRMQAALAVEPKGPPRERLQSKLGREEMKATIRAARGVRSTTPFTPVGNFMGTSPAGQPVKVISAAQGSSNKVTPINNPLRTIYDMAARKRAAGQGIKST